MSNRSESLCLDSFSSSSCVGDDWPPFVWSKTVALSLISHKIGLLINCAKLSCMGWKLMVKTDSNHSMNCNTAGRVVDMQRMHIEFESFLKVFKLKYQKTTKRWDQREIHFNISGLKMTIFLFSTLKTKSLFLSILALKPGILWSRFT